MQVSQHSQRRRVLIAGYGYIGQQLGNILLADRFEVHALRRRWPTPPVPGIICHTLDLTDGAALGSLPEFDYVVYAAAPQAFHDEAYRKVYVDGLRRVIERVRPRQRLILTSSTGIYGPGNGDWIDETSPVAAQGNFAATRLSEGENLLSESGLSSIAIRLGGIYGPGRSSLLDSVRNGTARLSRNDAPAIWTNRIHRDDAARSIRHLMTLANPSAVYLGVDDEPATRNDVLCFAAKLLGKSPPAVEENYIAPERGNRRCRNTRLRSTGFVFKYPTFREGLASLVDCG